MHLTNNWITHSFYCLISTLTAIRVVAKETGPCCEILQEAFENSSYHSCSIANCFIVLCSCSSSKTWLNWQKRGGKQYFSLWASWIFPVFDHFQNIKCDGTVILNLPFLVSAHNEMDGWMAESPKHHSYVGGTKCLPFYALK